MGSAIMYKNSALIIPIKTALLTGVMRWLRSIINSGCINKFSLSCYIWLSVAILSKDFLILSRYMRPTTCFWLFASLIVEPDNDRMKFRFTMHDLWHLINCSGKWFSKFFREVRSVYIVSIVEMQQSWLILFIETISLNGIWIILLFLCK